MSSSTGASAYAKPRIAWLDLWLHPQRMIKHTAGKTSTVLMLLLGAAEGIYTAYFLVGERANTSGSSLVNWLLFATAAGAVFGIAYLYLNAAIMAGLGRLLRGRATMSELREAQAWSQVPLLYVLPLILGALGVFGVNSLKQITLEEDLSNPYLLFIALLSSVAGLYSLFLLVRMVGAVQNFGIFRSILNASGLSAILIPLQVIRIFAFQPFSIPSSSMAPTLLPGDTIFANKFSYGYGRYSFLADAGFSGRLIAREPERGDIAIHVLPNSGGVTYVKRIIGLPGDKIDMNGTSIEINGITLSHKYLGRAEDVFGSEFSGYLRYQETLPSGVSYEVFYRDGEQSQREDGTWTVPSGHYFMIGDNRDNSSDSRFSQIGYIPYDNLVGRALVIFLSIDTKDKTLQTDRIFRVLR